MRLLSLLLVLFFITTLSSTAQWQCGDDLIDVRDGQVYKTVNIGGQCWMAENLNVGTMIPTTKPGYEMADNGVMEKYCWDNDEGNCDGSDGKEKRGGFYEWKEMLQFWSGQPELPHQGICPEGWHVPSYGEWNELFTYLGGMPATCDKMLENGDSGFEAKVTGYRCTMTGSCRASAMDPNKFKAYFWSATEADAENSPILEFGDDGFQTFSFSKSLGLSVRCLLDEPVSVGENSDSDKFKILSSYLDNNRNLVLNFVSPTSSNMNLKMYDLWGRKIMNDSFNSSEGENFTRIALNKLSPGCYFIVLGGTSKTVSCKIMLY